MAELLMDEEGENRAVRCFLMQYGTPGLTVGAMQRHMIRCGFPHWPAWVEVGSAEHLTKAGAQIWLRHLFALEDAPSAAASGPAPAQAVQPMIVADKRDAERYRWLRTHFDSVEVADLNGGWDVRIAALEETGDVARASELDAAIDGSMSHSAAEMVSAAQRRKATDEEIRAWAERHDLGIGSLTDLRGTFEDAQSLHLTFGVKGGA